MTDRELLEFAAKAAGFDSAIDMYGIDEFENPLLDANDPPTVWNPLTDDGDALRLAVKLGFSVDTDVGVTRKCIAKSRLHAATSIEEAVDDPYAATRRAIVRAAAEIGKLEGRK